jgi:hypothetical protein
MEDDNKIARIGFITLHISYSLHFQHTKHTMFKILTLTNFGIRLCRDIIFKRQFFKRYVFVC